MPPSARQPSTADAPPPRAARVAMVVVLAVPFVAVAVAFAIGARAPAERHLERSIEVARPADEVRALLADPLRQPAWWRQVARVEPMAAEGTFRQVLESERTAHVTVEHGDTDAGLLWRIRDPAGPYRGTWRFELVPVAESTRVTLTEDARLGNPFARFLVAIAGGSGDLVDGCLRDLAAWARTTEPVTTDNGP